MRIGILNKAYAYQRLVISSQLGKYVNIRYNNLYFWIRLPYIILLHLGIIHRSTKLLYKINYEFYPIIPNFVHLMHLYNAVNMSNAGDWILNIEHCVPYCEEVTQCIDSHDGDFSRIKNNNKVSNVLKACCSPNCKHIVAISECAKQIQLKVAEQFPLYYEKIKKKTIVIHPSQSLLISNINEKPVQFQSSELFTFIFIGSHFYRKGGRETLKALNLLHQKYNFQLYLIGDASQISFKAPMLSDNDILESNTIINSNKNWIHYYKKLPNNEVIDLIKHSHIALLPTWSDSYGFSILECQACGTPVISTSIRALPEINNNNTGWIIDVPTNAINQPITETNEEKKIFELKLLQGLYKYCEFAILNLPVVKQKAINCLNIIEEKHNPTTYKENLQMLYSTSLY